MGGRLLERLGEQLLEVEHVHAAVGEGVGEHVVLLACALDPQYIVEEQLILVGRREPLELDAGPVQQHPAQPADLGMHPREGSALGAPLRGAGGVCEQVIHLALLPKAPWWMAIAGRAAGRCASTGDSACTAWRHFR